jgi:hypothetical protein
VLRARISERATEAIRSGINPVRLGEAIAVALVGLLQEVVEHEVDMTQDAADEKLEGVRDELGQASGDWEELTGTVRRFHDEHHPPGFRLCAEPICRAAQGSAA